MDLGGYKSRGVEEETGGSAREGGTYFGPGGGRREEGGPRVNEGIEAGATTESRRWRRRRRWRW